jgi:phosphoribosylformimino-5-aminoimidazole carboxamide ribotide isomerase
VKEAGVRTVIYTDINRDGMMSGPNVEATARLREATGLEIIASGGVSSLEDIRRLLAAQCEGAILGKALLEGAFTLPEALAVTEKA